jgi:GntR family transcriptional regulator, arabinose operon transcriptional repressor
MTVLEQPNARKRERIADDLRALALKMEPGERFPSAPELKRAYGVAAGTVEAALETLRSEGLIVRRRGSGTFVARPARAPHPQEAGGALVTLAGSSGEQLPYVRRLLDELTGYAARHGRRVVSHYAAYGPSQDGAVLQVEETLRYALELEVMRPQGYLLVFWEQAPVARELIRRGHRAVVLGVPPPGTVPDVPCVCGDHEAGGYLAARHLLDLGHRRLLFAHCLGATEQLERSRRWRGYCRALREAAIEPRAAGNELFQPGVLDALFGAPDAPTGVVFWTDVVAARLWPLFQARGLRVPDDVSMIGYDNTPPPGLFPLDSIDQALERQVEDAARLLETPAGEAPTPPSAPMHVFAPQVVVRGSCAAPPPSRAR